MRTRFRRKATKSPAISEEVGQELLAALRMTTQCLIDLAPYEADVTIGVVAIVESARATIAKADGSNDLPFGCVRDPAEKSQWGLDRHRLECNCEQCYPPEQATVNLYRRRTKKPG